MSIAVGHGQPLIKTCRRLFPSHKERHGTADALISKPPDLDLDHFTRFTFFVGCSRNGGGTGVGHHRN